MVSIIIPVYNAEKYLKGAVESVLKQNYQDWELILVDDGSGKTCCNLCDAIASSDARIKVVHTKNQGVTAARSYGVTVATGEWICFLDADDTLLKNAIQTMIDKSEGCDIVIGNKQIITNDKIEQEFTNTTDKQISAFDFLSDLITNRISQYITGRIFHKTLFDDGTISIPKDLIMAEDFIMNVQLGNKAKRVSIITDMVYGYHVYNESVSHTFKTTLEYENMFCTCLEKALRQGKYYDNLKEELAFQKVRALKAAFIAQKGMLNLNDNFLITTIKDAKNLTLTRGWRLFLKLVTMRKVGYIFLKQLDRQ